MDLLRLASPWMLVLVLPAWAIILYAALGPRPRPSGARGRAALSSLAAGLLAAALAGPSVRVSRQGLCPVVIVEDASPSMAIGRPEAKSDAVLASWTAALPRGQVQLVPFPSAAISGTASAGGGTCLADALKWGAQSLPDGQGLLVLYSDGRETRGDAAAEARRLAARGIRLFAVVPDLRPHDARVVSLRPLSEPAAGQPFHIEVRAAATACPPRAGAPTEATIRLTRRSIGPAPGPGSRSWERRVALDTAPGEATLIFDDGPLPPGRYEFSAEVAAPADNCPQNNRARCLVQVGDYRELLYLQGAGGPGPLLDLLKKIAPRGHAVLAQETGSPSAIASASVIVLDNMPAWRLGDYEARRLARRVIDSGTGLLVLGGNESFAAGGYGESPLEDLLPVSSRAGERPPLDLVLILDSSGSMNEKVGSTEKITLAKQAALALEPALGQTDRIGLVAFAAEPRVLSPLAPGGAYGLRASTLGISAGGGTRITPAVEAAIALYAATDNPKARRHVILLSDGRSDDFDLPRLVANCRQRNITLSAVATGVDADLPRMGRLASETGGHLYATGDLARLRETFFKDMMWARGENLREEPAAAVWSRPQPIWTAPGPPLPAVPAWNATRAKQGADVHWVTAPQRGAGGGTPLLASWRRGLGKVVAMPWPVGGDAEAWAAGGTLDRSLAAVLAWLAAVPAPADWSARLVEREGQGWIRVEERMEIIGQSTSPFVAAVLAADEAEVPGLAIGQVAPGIYEAPAQVRSAAAAVVAVHREDKTGERVLLSVPDLPPPEFERLGVDRERLGAIARAGGGEILSTPRTLVDAVRRMESRGYEPAGVYLAGAAGAVVLLQVVLRLMGRL